MLLVGGLCFLRFCRDLQFFSGYVEVYRCGVLLVIHLVDGDAEVFDFSCKRNFVVVVDDDWQAVEFPFLAM